MCIYIDAPIYKYRNVGRASWAGRYPRALEELPFHLTQSRGWSRLEEVLLDLRFIDIYVYVDIYTHTYARTHTHTGAAGPAVH